MITLRQLKQYSFRMFRETLFYVLLFIDLIGILVTYFTSLNIPLWVLVLIPIVAVFLAGFNIYRQGTADARLVFLGQEDFKIDWTGSSRPIYTFVVALYGHIMNFGPQTGVLEQVSAKVGFNELFDSYVIDMMGLSHETSPLFDGKLSHHRVHFNSNQETVLPLVVKPGHIQPFTLFITVTKRLNYTEDHISEMLHWLDYVNVNITYCVRDRASVETREVKLKVPVEPLWIDVPIE